MTVYGTVSDFALAALGERMVQSTDLTDLVPAADIKEGPDPEVWEQPSQGLFPAIRYRWVSTPLDRGPRFGSVRMQIDEFVWPRDADAPSGRDGLAKIDRAVTDIVGPTEGNERVSWRFDGAQISVSASTVEANDYPASGPFRRGRRITVEVTG